MSAEFPTAAERCAVANVRELTAGLAFGLPPDVEQYVVRDAILSALAPLIRAREAAAWDAGAEAAWDAGFDAGYQYARAVNPEWPDMPTNPFEGADNDRD